MKNLTIQWNIGNVCNRNCSYCPDTLKDGSNLAPTFEQMSFALQNIKGSATEFESVMIELTGGEPTASDSIKEFLQQYNESSIKFKLHSNSSGGIEWWDSVIKNLYGVCLTFHIDETLADFEKVAELCHTLSDLHINVVVSPDQSRWNHTKTVFETFRNKYNSVNLQLLYKNFTIENNVYESYSKDQWDYYYQSIGIDPTDNEAIKKTIEYTKQHKLNKFFGNLCWAGVDQIVIDNFGNVYRGWCYANGYLGNVFKDQLKLDNSPRPCPKEFCRNGFDMLAKKSKNSWGMV